MTKTFGLLLILGFGLLKGVDKAPSVVQLKPSISLSRSNPRMLFEVDGKLAVAYPAVDPKSGARKLRIALFDPRDGSEIRGQFYDLPIGDLIQDSGTLLLSRDTRTLYFVNLKGAPVILMIDANSLDILSRSDVSYFGVDDYLPHAEMTTQDALVLAAASRVPGQAVHVVFLDARDASKKIADHTIPLKPGWGSEYRISDDGQAVWLGSGKHWRKTKLTDGQLDGVIDAANDVQQLIPASGEVVGLTDLAHVGFLQSFSEDGRRLQTKVVDGCGFVSGRISLNSKYGVAVCESTGTSEWNFGKRANGRAIVFDVPTLDTVATLPVVKRGTAYPPAIWVSNEDIAVGESDSQGSVRVWHLRH